MRLATAPEIAVFAAPRDVRARVEIQNKSGTWKDFTNLSGTGFTSLDFFKSLEWTTNIDAPTWTGTLTLAREVQGVSIAPHVETSPANVDDLGAYAPAVNGMRRMRAFASSAILGASLVGTEKKVFDGYILDVKQPDDLALPIADLGHALVRKQMEEDRVYSTTAGEYLEVVLQQMLDINMGAGAYTLVVDPAIALTTKVRQFKPGRVKLMEALRNTAQQTIGAVVRYMWNDAGEMELRLFLPPRGKTIADYTFSKDDYYNVRGFDINVSDVRNKGRLYFMNDETRVVSFVEAKVQESIDEFGEQYFELSEDASSQIDSRPEAQTMLNRALNDMARPLAEKGFTTRFMWAADIYDLYTLLANDQQYTTDQKMAVSTITHRLGDQVETEFLTRGTVAGYYDKWKIQEGIGAQPKPPTAWVAGAGFYTEASCFGGELRDNEKDGMIWYMLWIRPQTSRVKLWARQTKPNTDGSPPSVLAKPAKTSIFEAWDLIRPEGKIPRGDPDFENIWRTAVYVPTRPNHGRSSLLEASDANGYNSPKQMYDSIAIDVIVGVDLDGFSQCDVERIAPTTVRVRFDPLPPINWATVPFVCVMRDGIPLEFIELTGLTFPYDWLDEEISSDKSFRYDVFQWAAGISGPRTIVDVGAWTAAVVTAVNAVVVDGEQRVRVSVTGLPVGTEKVRIEKSPDAGVNSPWQNYVELDPDSELPFDDAVYQAEYWYRAVALDEDDEVIDVSAPVYWTPL